MDGGGARVGPAGFDPKTYHMQGDGIVWVDVVVASGFTLHITVNTKENNNYYITFHFPFSGMN